MTRIEQIENLYKQYGVNEKLLHRDYKNDPIKIEGIRNLIAKPDREDLKYLYSILGMKAVEIGLIYGGIPACSILRYVNEYELPKPEQTKNRTTSMDTTRDRYVCYELVENNKIKHIMVKEPKELKTENNQNIKIYIDEFVKVYIGDNLSVAEMMKYYNMKHSTVMNIVKFLRLKKDPKRVKEIYRKTMKEKYGYENGFQVPEIKEKAYKTMDERYGMRFQKTQAYRDKVFNTKLERYGNGKYQNMEKVRETNMERYGVYIPAMKKGKEKLYAMLKADDPTELIAYIKEKQYQSIKDFANQEGFRPNTIAEPIVKFNLHYLFPNKRSALEIDIHRWISQYDDNLKSSLKMPNRKEIDIYDDKRMIGFEVNGNLWHSQVHHDENYHYEKVLEASKMGYRLIHIYEYEWVAKKKQIQGFIKDFLGVYEKNIDFNQCKVNKVLPMDVANFIKDNSIYDCEDYTDSLGLFYQEELVALILLNDLEFGEYEIVQYCKKLNYRIDNWFVKLCGNFIHQNSIKTIYGYSDVSKSDGSEFHSIGFKPLGLMKPKRLLVKYKTIIKEQNITYDVLRKHNVKFTKKDVATKSPEDILEEKFFDEIFDCGRIKWIWKPE